MKKLVDREGIYQYKGIYMSFVTRIFCILLLSSTVFAQIDTFSEADQLKAMLRLKIWQETLEARILVRADIAVAYINLDEGEIQEAIRNEAGFQEEEIKRWSEMKSTEFAKSLNDDLEPLGERLKTVKNLDEFDGFFAEADQLAYERSEQVQAQILKEIGPERLLKLREIGLQIQPYMDGSSIDFKAYEFLDLTEEQRTQLETVRNEYIQGLDKYAKEMGDFYEECVDLEMEWGEKGEEAIKENEAFLQEEAKRLGEKGETITQRFNEQIQSVKVKISLLLTPRQTERLEQIIAKTPDWLKSLKKEESVQDDDTWKDSWKPGDPVPEGKSRPKERKSFPLKVM